MDFFRSDGKFIYLEKPYAEFYIPQSYFENKFAEDQGSEVKVMGLFNIGFFENDKLTNMKILNLPTWINLFLYDYESRKVNLPGETLPVPCRVIKYFKGNKVMSSGVIEDSSNAELFLKFITQGKLPPSIPYESAIHVWRKNQSLNGINLGVPSVIEELILSAAYRDKNNPSSKFAFVIGKGTEGVTQFDYKMASIRQICQYTSTFSAITFEDIDSMITTSLNRTRDKTPEMRSPLEDVIKM